MKNAFLYLFSGAKQAQNDKVASSSSHQLTASELTVSELTASEQNPQNKHSFIPIDFSQLNETQAEALVIFLLQIDQISHRHRYAIISYFQLKQGLLSLNQEPVHEVCQQLQQDLTQISMLQHQFFDRLPDALKSDLSILDQAKVPENLIHLSDWQAFFQCHFPHLQLAQLSPKALIALIKAWHPQKLTQSQQEYHWLKHLNTGFLLQIIDPEYGVLLRGQGIPKQQSLIGIVGTREADRDGRQLTEKIVQRAAQLDLAIISGGAIGIDECAHLTALKQGSQTYVVYGCGLYHVNQQKLKGYQSKENQIVALSPFYSMQKAEKWTFVERNQWIAYLCTSELLFVIQAGAQSGTLSTAKTGLALKKEVWVCPGPILSPLYEGCHWLIQQGALILTHILEGLERYEQKKNSMHQQAFSFDTQVSPIHMIKKQAPSNKAHYQLWTQCSHQIPLSIQELAERTQLNIDEVAIQVTMLELEGFLMPKPGGKYLKSYPS